MHKSQNSTTLHFWVPNLFEFKGGIQVYLQNVLEALNHELPTTPITIYNKLDKTSPNPSLNHQNYYIYCGKTPQNLRTIHYSLNLAIGSIKKHPDLILCGHLNFAPVAYYIHRLTGIPYWIFVYGTDAWNIKNSIKKNALHSAQKIISISAYTRERLIAEQNLNPNRISLLPVTFDASRFQIAPKPNKLLQKYNLTPEQAVILTVTRLSSSDGYKGYDKIIQALPKIQQTLPNIHYLIVGQGDDLPRIEKLIKNLNLQNSVTLTGFIPDQELPSYYNLCDVFAMPSKGEGFGIVYLEALASGKPTLGGNQDGAIDALCNGQLGALIDPDNINEIAQTLTQILQGKYPHPLIYQPEKLRQRTLEIFGFQRFQNTVSQLLSNSPLEVKK
jgi:phosphatidylinositol alpha-1,6-mannosyltransferase